MGGRVIFHLLAGFGFLGACIDERHHAVHGLVHLVIFVTHAQMLFQVGFFLFVSAAGRPVRVFRMVELETAVKVVIHKIGMVRVRGRQPAEQAQVVRIVQRLDTDR